MIHSIFLHIFIDIQSCRGVNLGFRMLMGKWTSKAGLVLGRAGEDGQHLSYLINYGKQSKVSYNTIKALLGGNICILRLKASKLVFV